MKTNVREDLSPQSLDLAIRFNLEDLITALTGCGRKPSEAFTQVKANLDKYHREAEADPSYE